VAYPYLTTNEKTYEAVWAWAKRLVTELNKPDDGGSPTPGGSRSPFDTVNLIDDFGGVGDGVTDNAAAFAAAEASPYYRIRIPEGMFYTSASRSLLTKHYYGPGRINAQNTSKLPGRFSFLAVRPPPSGTGENLWFAPTAISLEPEWFIIGPNARTGIDAQYFEPAIVPHNQWFNVQSGGSGYDTATTSAIGSGATSVSVDVSSPGAAPLSNGDQIAFTSIPDGPITHTATVISLSGSTLTFSPGAPSGGLPSGAIIFRTKRTNSSLYYQRVQQEGAGDVYGIVIRARANYPPTAGQKHIFFGGTIGLYGGDMTALVDGGFLTASEVNIDGGVYDIGAVGQIFNFQRNNKTQARGAFWSGIQLKSEGSQPLNNGLCLIGKYDVGLDLALADFGTNKIAMALANQQRIYFNNTAGDPSRLYTLYSSASGGIGDSYMTHDSDGTSPFLDIFAGAGYRLRMRSNGIAAWNGQLNISNGLNVNAGNANFAGNVGVAGRLYMNPAQTAWIEYIGIHIWATQDGGANFNLIV